MYYAGNISWWRGLANHLKSKLPASCFRVSFGFMPFVLASWPTVLCYEKLTDFTCRFENLSPLANINSCINK